MSDNEMPLVSIITVSYNSEKTIKNTIQSVLNQTYTKIEYIIIDGASTDNTLSIIKQCEPLFPKKNIVYKYISEPDSGIYEAMNKGIKMIRDQNSLVLFLNADDYLFHNNIIHDCVSRFSQEDFIYGKVMLEDDIFRQVVGKKQSFNTLPMGMIQHQATFTRKKIFDEIGLFDESYKIVADYEFAIRVFSKGVSTLYIDDIVSVMRMGGISSTASTFREKKRVFFQYYSGSLLFKSILRVNIVEMPRNLIANIFSQFSLLKYWRILKQIFIGLSSKK